MRNRNNDDDWVIVYTTSTEFEALLIKGMLENEDIPAQVLSQIDTTRQFTLGALSIAKIFVLKSDYEVAKKLIEENEKK
ncbi:DUF2007 domain-containing protein [bacterium]|nr:MAG: DUF2007 domain-containing protein [bacterium]